MRRGALLLPLAALAVHQLRYLLAYGPNAGEALAHQGHAYLDSLVPWILLAAGAGVGALLSRAAAAWRAPHGKATAAQALLKLWLSASAALLVIYAAQELAEGWLATGHATGLGAPFAGGGFWAVPAALWVGGLVALLLRGAQAVIARLARRRRSPAPRRTTRTRRPRPVARRVAAPLATGAAGRAPPRS